MVSCVYFVDEGVFISLVNFTIQITYNFLLWLRILSPVPEDVHPILYILIFVIPSFFAIFLSVPVTVASDNCFVARKSDIYQIKQSFEGDG